MAFDLAVRGGTLVDGTVADLGIAGGIIAQIGGEVQADVELDAHGKLVLPGGVDAHVHLSNPPRESVGPTWVDDFASGSAAALAGGITSVGNMTFGAPDETPLAALRRETEVAQREAIADVFLHPVLGVPDERVLDEIPRLLEQGCSSIKIFLSNPRFDVEARGYIEAIRRAGASGLISMLHCEDAALLTHATEQLVSSGRTSLQFFGASRPIVAEVVATQRAVAMCELTGHRSTWYTCRASVHLTCAPKLARAGCRCTSRLGRCTCTSIRRRLTGPTPVGLSASHRCASLLTSQRCGPGWPAV